MTKMLFSSLYWVNLNQMGMFVGKESSWSAKLSTLGFCASTVKYP